MHIYINCTKMACLQANSVCLMLLITVIRHGASSWSFLSVSASDIPWPTDSSHRRFLDFYKKMHKLNTEKIREKIAKIMTIIKDLWKLLGLKGLSKRSCFSLFQNDAVNCGAPCWLSVIVLRMKPHCLQHLLRWDPLGSIGNKQVKRQLPKSRTPGCAASNAKCSIKEGKLYKSS